MVLLDTNIVIGYLAEDAGELRRATKLATADAVIAATALSHSLLLITRDHDFTALPELKLLLP